MRLMAPLLVALLFVATAKAATHVNISIGHELAKNPSDVTYVDGQVPAELRAGASNMKHHSDFSFSSEANNQQFGHLRAANNGGLKYQQSSARLTASDNRDGHHTTDFGYSNDAGNQHFGLSRASARLVDSNDRSHVDSANRQKQFHQTGFNERTSEQYKQNQQNQEFERYIQNYHSGPTVETVFESNSPSQRQKSSSSSSSSSSSTSSSSNGQKSQRVVAIGSSPSQMHTFERQVALPTPTPAVALLPPSDERQTHTIVNHQPKSVNNAGDAGSSFASSSSSSSSNNFDQSGYEQSGNSFNKPNYGYDDSDVQNQYPPSVDESQSNFYHGHDRSGSGFFVGSTPASGYLPSYQRPVVTKTIQIAQPALKAKKYEIRHPAIQKEFYDIEERVVIKPAGTIVVELEHPVAKIPKGETILPLGHPHPAVASAYNTNGAAVVQTMGSDVVNNGNSNNNNNHYSPSPVYIPKASVSGEPQHLHTAIVGSTTIGSTLTTTPTYDASSKNDFVESNLNKQFNAEAQYVTTTERSYNEDKQNDEGFFVTTTESNRNYEPQHFYGRDETDRRYSGHVGQVDVKTNGAPGQSTSFSSNNQQSGFGVSGQATYGSGRSQYQPNYNDNNQYKGEFISGEFYNHQQGPKPARLQEQPKAQVVKHEHNIHLPASQHNIYLGQLKSDEDMQQNERLTSGPRYREEAAHVLELKPYLKHHPGSVVVYAASNQRPAMSSFNNQFNQQRNYDSPRYSKSQGRNYYSASQNKVQYSAPYSNMRHHPDQSARYVYGSEYNYKDNSSPFMDTDSNNNDGYQQDAPAKSSAVSSGHAHAHIQIQIPHHPQEADKPIVVSSTISPIVHKVNAEHVSKYRQQSAYYNDNESSRLTAPSSDQDDQQQDRYDASANIGPLKPGFNNQQSADYKFMQQKSLRIVESPNGASSDSGSSSSTGAQSVGGIDVNLKSTSGHVATPHVGSRVIAATPAPTDAASASESFHKRRIVVNHPFQTVREVVEHEPITNYHHVQVNEPASPELYHHTAPYYQQETHGAIRQAQPLPLLYHHHSATTHGNLHYAPVFPLGHGVAVGYHHHG